MPTPATGLNVKDKAKAYFWLFRFILKNVVKNPNNSKEEIKKIEEIIMNEMKKFQVTNKEIEELVKKTFPEPEYKIHF